MPTLIFLDDPMVDPHTAPRVTTANVIESVVEHFGGSWPANVRIYHEQVAHSQDVTPARNDKAGIDRLLSLEGKLYVVAYPLGGISTIIAIVAVVVTAVTVAVALFTKPKIPTAASRANFQSQSPNNALSGRTNEPRPNERIPDIVGTVRSTPDALTVPVTQYIGHQEVEDSVLCITRGECEYSDIRDGDTLVSQIDGTTVEIYGPHKDINAHEPDYRLGARIEDNAVFAARSNSVNGQTLRPSNIASLRNQSFAMRYPGTIVSSGVSFADYFEAGDTITLTATVQYQDDEGEAQSFSLNGDYTISGVNSEYLYLQDAPGVNPNWSRLAAFPDQQSERTTTNITGTSERWVGWFIVDNPNTNQLWLNIVAQSGIYKDNGQTIYAASVETLVEVQKLDANLQPVGAVSQYTFTVDGSSLRSSRGITAKITNAYYGACRIRARRTTNEDKSFNGSVVDEIKWRDLYAIGPLTVSNFGNVTIIKTRTWQTSTALALKERKLNLLVTRKLPRRISGNQFTTALYPTNNIADIFCWAALEPHIGNRKLEEIDVDNIYDIIAQAQAYFGFPESVEFSYTFDNDKFNAEETLAVIAQAAGCIPYRRGNVIRLFFERQTDRSSLLFNHRNKLPGTETRSYTFGYSRNNDGVEYQYVDPEDDALVTIYLPEDQSAINPDRIESVGIRNKQQALIHAWRAYNKLKYQYVSVEFTATQEAELLLPNERILVADNTYNTVMDGEVQAQEGQLVALERYHSLEAGQEYMTWFQLPDGTVDTIKATPQADKRILALARAPLVPLATDDRNYARATYIITDKEDRDITEFLITEINPRDVMTSTVTAVNYDDRYYQKDRMYKDAS